MSLSYIKEWVFVHIYHVLFAGLLLVPTVAFAQNSGSVSLNGDAYLSINHNSAYNFANSFTIEMWFKPTSLPATGLSAGLAGKGGANEADPTVQNMFYLALTNNALGTSGRNLVFGFENSAGSNFQVAYPVTHTLNQWYHVAGVYNSSTKSLSLYQNGALVAQQSNLTSLVVPNKSPISIGRLFSDSSASSFKGVIDDVRLWNGARSATSISGAYRKELVGSESGLVGYWKLNEGVNLTASDRSITANPASLVRATWSKDVPFGAAVAARSSLRFNSTSYVSVPHKAAFSVTSAFTIQAWFKLDQVPANGQVFTLFAKGANGDSIAAKQHNYYLALGNNALGATGLSLIGGYEDSSGVNHAAVFKTLPTTNQWYQATLSYSAATRTLILYMNGTEVARQSSLTVLPVANSEAITIGRLASDAQGNSMMGNIDDVRLWNKALSTSEITGSMGRELVGNEVGLVGYWKFNDGSGLVAKDSVAGTNGAISGATWSTEFPYAFAGLTPLASPANLTAQLGSSQLMLSWSAISGASSYHVKRSTSANGPYALIGTTSQSSFADTKIVSGATYYYVVSALNSNTESGDSHQIGITINNAVSSQAVVTQGPILGAATASSIKILARTNQTAAIKIAYKKSTESTYTTTGAYTTNAAKDNTVVVTLSGLSPSTLYSYKIFADGAEVTSLAGSFTTLPVAGLPSKFSFTYGSDLNAAMAPHTIMAKLDAKNPLFNLLIGDIIYADVSPAAKVLSEYRVKYQQNLVDPSMRNLLRNTPSVFMWDDHEIANDWSAGKTGQYLPARQAFDEYIGAVNPAPLAVGEIYYAYDVGQVSFFVMDTRTYRSPNSATDNSSKTMLGLKQKTALFNWLSTSKAKFKFVISSVPVSDFGTTGSDSWSGFKTERTEIYNYIKSHNVKGVLYVIGDQHWSMVAKLNVLGPSANLYEFMPTPLNAVIRSVTPSTDPQILFKQSGAFNYGYFTVDTTVTPARLTYINYDSNNSPLYQLTITEKDINP